MINNINLPYVLSKKPDAYAILHGSSDYPELQGTVKFYRAGRGILVYTCVSNLPQANEKCSDPIFAYHIHSGNSCTGHGNDPFANALSHYNPSDCEHPYHAGDMPPLFSANGEAVSVYLSNRFLLSDIIGRAVIIHSMPDDLATQPSGNSGSKIACGIIVNH